MAGIERTNCKVRATSATAARTDWLPRPLRAKVKDYWMLTKPEVNFLVVSTSGAAFYLAANRHMDWLRAFPTLIGTLLVASGTATLNEYMERRDDAEMHRTAKRPLPAGRLKPVQAFAFGITISILGALQLWLGANLLASSLAVLTLLSYLLIYTPLKKTTAWCTFIGAFPGQCHRLLAGPQRGGDSLRKHGSCLGLCSYGNFRISYQSPGFIVPTIGAHESACSRTGILPVCSWPVRLSL